MARNDGSAYDAARREARAIVRDPHDIVIDELESILREACLTPVP